MSKDIRHQYLETAIMSLCDSIDERIKKFEADYKKMQFGMQFFLDIEVNNFLMDLVYFRDVHLKAHLQLCRMLRIDKKEFVVEHAMYYVRKLQNVELMSVIQLMKLDNPSFGLSEAEKKRCNDEMCRIAHEVMNEILAEEQANVQ